MTLYAIQLAEAVGWNGDQTALMRAALLHDIPEGAFGDHPGPGKRLLMDEWHVNEVEYKYVRSRFPEDAEHWALSKTDGDIKALIKTADLLDEIMFLQTEAQLGNRNAGALGDLKTPLGNSFRRLKAIWADTPLLAASNVWPGVLAKIEAAGSDYSDIILDGAA